MSDDIVARMRAWVLCYRTDTDIALDLTAAADEIERLHRDYSCICSEMRRMMEERDEARRLFCELDAEMYGLFGDKERLVVNRASYLPSDAARKRKWDCFREAADA